MAKKAKVYRMWALFNYDRPPIFIETTRRECVTQGINWIGSERAFKHARREGSLTIKKVIVRSDATGVKP